MNPALKELLTTPTGIIAIWGAILSTVTLLWNVRRDLVQKAEVVVTVDVAMIVEPGMGIVANRLLRYSMVNRGQRPVTIVNVGGKVKRHPTNATKFVVLHDPQFSQLPRTLGHSETASVLAHDLSVLGDNLAQMWVTDSTGKHWKATKRSMRALRQAPEWGKHSETSRGRRA